MNNRLDKSELFMNNDLYFKIFVANMTFWSLTDKIYHFKVLRF